MTKEKIILAYEQMAEKYNELLGLRSKLKKLVQVSWLGLFQKSLQTCEIHFFCKTGLNKPRGLF